MTDEDVPVVKVTGLGQDSILVQACVKPGYSQSLARRREPIMKGEGNYPVDFGDDPFPKELEELVRQSKTRR